MHSWRRAEGVEPRGREGMNWRDKTGLGFEEGEGKKRREALGGDQRKRGNEYTQAMQESDTSGFSAKEPLS